MAKIKATQRHYFKEDKILRWTQIRMSNRLIHSKRNRQPRKKLSLQDIIIYVGIIKQTRNIIRVLLERTKILGTGCPDALDHKESKIKIQNAG